MEILLNKLQFTVNDNEFDILHKPEYSTLQIYPQHGIFERELGLIKEITKINKYSTDNAFINIGLSHGGYLPLNLLEYVTKIYIITKELDQIHNFKQNCIRYESSGNSQIIILNNLSNITTSNYLKIIKFNSSNDTDNINIVNDMILNISFNINNNTIILSYAKINSLNNYHKCYELINSKLLIYVSYNLINDFEKKFNYYLECNLDLFKLNYNNLINLCMIVKNAGDGFKNILEENLPYIDEWTILDTGSTDNTVQIIKEVLSNKKGNLHEELFVGFSESRNRCLELAGEKCKFNIMIDDTYILKGNVRNFLELLRSDQFADSYNIFINSNNNTYGSNRILKSDRKLKYIYDVHEIIQQNYNLVVQLPFNEIYIDDIASEYMQERTLNRKKYDLENLHLMLTKYPNDPRTLYYITQTYCELKEYDKAYEFALKRINDTNNGYDEEITECYLICGNIAEYEFKWEWNKCEKIYLECYNHDKSKADALYCIGIHYISVNDNISAYKYLKKAFNLGISQTATSNLRISIYNTLLPEILTSLCYTIEKYKIGQKSAEKYLQLNNNNNDTIKSFLNIYKLLNLNNDISKLVNNKNIITAKKIICFVADGNFKNWSGSSINKEGIGGSETFIIELSRHIANALNYNYEIYVFCKTDADEIFDNVNYKNINDYVHFLNNNKITICIISRFSEYIPVTIKNDVDSIYLIVHDLIPSGNAIPIDNKLKGILCMSEWHKNYFLNYMPMFKDLTFIFPNGINVTKYPINYKKKKHSFIYSSFANRGLINLLKMFPKIRTKLPSATLNIFCDTNNEWLKSISNDEMILIDKLIYDQKEYVKNYGWVNKDILTQFFLESEFFLYPCTFQETFCVTALEAAISNTLIITNNYGALINTVGDRGIIIPGNANTQEWQDLAIEQLINITNNEDMKINLINKNRKWAENYDWKILSKQFIDKYININENSSKNLINNENNIGELNYCKMLNWTNDIPIGSKSIFLNILNNFKNKYCKILEIGTYTGTSIINMLNYLPESFGMYTSNLKTILNYIKSYIRNI